MTILGWILLGLVAVVAIGGAIFIGIDLDNASSKVLVGVIAVAIVAVTFFGLQWYFNNTASGQRALVNQKSELNNGLNRIVTVYTADGEIIAQYEGQIDIEEKDGGYVLFDYNGKRYTYYNCFVESIADIE